MNQLFIVDDEEMERDSLCELCNWSELGISILGVARNGKIALEKISSEKPDIIITDVKMPVMDGLEFAKLAKQMYPDVKIIFISGYDDFAAAKEAIRLNASAYLLKPVNISELFQTVYNVVNEFVVEKFKNEENEQLQNRLIDSMPLVRDSFIRDLMLGIKEYDDEIFFKRASYLGLNIPGGWYSVLLISIHHLVSQSEEIIQKKILLSMESVNKVIGQYQGSYVVQTYDSEMSVLLRLSDISENEVVNEINRISIQLINNIKSETNLSTSIGISSVSQDIMMLRQLYRQSKIALAQRIFQESSNVFFYEDGNDCEQKGQLPDIEILQNRIEENLWLANAENITHAIDEYFDKLSRTENIDMFYIKSICLQIFGRAIITLHEMNREYEKSWIYKFFVWDSLKKIETLFECREYVKSILLDITDHLFINKMDDKLKIVHKVKQYITNNYYENISIESIARELYLSSGYMSKIFKGNTGITIQEYITSYRMDIACSLLKNTNDKIIDIANSVGYDSSSYFGTVFKSIYNMTPSEYQKKSKEEQCYDDH